MSFAKITLIGNVGQEPELKYTPQGNAVCTFSVAVNKKDSNGEKITLWWRATAWRQTAEFASQRLKKGHEVYIEGEPGLEMYVDKEGATRASLTLTVKEIQFLD